MPFVNSSAIQAIDHDSGSLQLYITFVNSGRYTYYGVPRGIYEAFLAAPSKGSYYNDYIKDRYSETRF